MSRFDRRDFHRAAAAGAASAALGSGAALTPAIVRAQPKKLRIGVLLPRSGVLAKLGQSCQMGADIAPALLSEIYGVEVELMNVDFESKVDEARARAEKLVAEGAQVLVGPFDSGAAAAIAQVAEQRKVPFVINVAAAPQITKQGYRYTFRNFPTAGDLVMNGLALCRDLFQATGTAPRKAVLMHVNDTFGLATRRAIDAIFPKLDFLPFRIVETISYDLAARDLSVEVSKAKASGAEIVLLVCRLNDAIMLVREMIKQRFTPQGIISPGSPGMYEAAFYTSLGKYSEYCISNVPWFDPKSPLTALVDRQMKKQFPGEELVFHALNVGFTFEAMMTAADAFRRAGTADGPTLAEAIRRTDISQRVMLGGPIRFDAEGQNTAIASACIQNRNVRPTVVLPKASAEAAPVFPMPPWNQRT
ncbi:MAG: branched-chain amino acid ABC transporter [Lautropia sp. SCN 69-89]|nr:MAG: branched-chain amino acid ABC transporter [Lautropia sp. SCN 69-89]